METVRYQASDSLGKKQSRPEVMLCHWPGEWPPAVYGDEVHVIDPEGDVLLKLQRILPTEEFEPWGSPGVAYGFQAQTDIMPVTPSLLEHPVDHHSPRIHQMPELIEDDIASEDKSQLGQENKMAAENALKVYLQVSSRHLILASSVFKAMLGSSTFLEGNKLLSQGNLAIELADDPDAMIILMHIIHGATRKVPRVLSLDVMVRLATLVDYYQLHEAVELFSDTWVTYLKEKAFPKSCNSDVMPWLFISWVFKQEDAFKKVTELLIRQGDDMALDWDDFPIPPTISTKIKEQRNEAIESMIAAVHDHITKYLTSDILCPSGSFECDTIILGSLLKSSAMIGLWPRPFSPYRGITFNSLAVQIRKMQILDQCPRQGYRNNNACAHQIKETIDAAIKSLEDQYCGHEMDNAGGMKVRKPGQNKEEAKRKKGKRG